MLTVKNLDFSYGAVRTLRDLSLTAPSGRITAIMGRNGVGKTTLMRNIMGLLQPSSGQVLLGDKDLTRASANVRARSGIAIVPQGRQIFPKLTVEENLRVGLQARPDRSRTIPDDVLELFPILRSFLRRRGGDLSGGQQQQLAIARALVGSPRVLLLDEPTEGIQPNVIQQIGQVLRTLVSERQMIVLLVEQYLDFVREFASFFYIMNRGQMVANGETSRLEAHLVNEHLGV
jgi:urea transport system ATP-binding protein